MQVNLSGKSGINIEHDIYHKEIANVQRWDFDDGISRIDGQDR